jgi:light-regulated signal transduction histidine kinase (bacteriophytochrome)
MPVMPNMPNVKDAKDRISEEYQTTLNSFLLEAGEAVLQRGYELGREALEAKLGLLDVTESYVIALTEILTPISKESARAVSATREFLFTSLAPFEMTHRGYQDSISKLLKMNMALEQQAAKLSAVNRELETFSYTVSHDLRAPLRAIVGFSQILLEKNREQLDKEGRQHLSWVADSARRMGELVQGLLSLSKFSRQTLSRSTVDLSQMVDSIVQDLQNANPARQIDVSITKNVTVQADQQLLHIAMTNLLANAWKFTANKVDVEIEFGMIKKDDKDTYFLKDNGAGFDMKYVDKLFGPFQRLHSEAQFEGTGIGLATVRKIFERHGGKIWAEAKVNEGATFYFTL